jgi:hypothetical protein
MPNALFLHARHMPKGVLPDLNKPTNQIQNGYANSMGRPTQFFPVQILQLCPSIGR